MIKLPDRKVDEHLQDLAVRLAAICVRDTIIEDYHVAGKLSQAEMKAFNKEVANKLYTMLQILLSPDYEAVRSSPEFNRFFYRPGDWDAPELDQDFLAAVQLLKSSES